MVFVPKFCFLNFVENISNILKKSILLLFSTLLLIFSCKEKPAEKVIDYQAIKDSIFIVNQQKIYHTALDSLLDQSKFNGIISVNINEKPVYEKALGFSNFKTKDTINHNSVFAIASNSKQFAGVIILQLQEQNLLNLSDKVSQYVERFKTKSYQDISISQLLHHSSGLNFMGEKLLLKSGTAFHYSNDGYKILGDIVEKVTKKSYDDNVMALFSKLGMTQSSTGNLFHGNNFASAYLGSTKEAKEVENMPKRLDKNHISIAAGGILSTVEDLQKWNFALYSGKILSPESLAEFLKPEQSTNHYILGKVGYGCGIMISPKLPETYMHTGYVKGSPSLLIYYPKTKTSVVILSNIANESLGKKAIYKVHKMIKEQTDALQNSSLE